MMVRQVLFEIRRIILALPNRQLLSHPLVITILVASLVGVTSGEVVASSGGADRVVIGNTGGTLSIVIRANGSLIVIGGGNARTDLADLVGRSTVPWRRHINLLIVPGWDDQQAIGALGLVERGGVKQLIILGTPPNSAVSRALQQAVAERGIPLSVVTGHNAVDLAHGVSLEVEAGQPSVDAAPEYAVFVLHYGDSTITFVDATNDGLKAMGGDGVSVERTHILVDMRSLAGLSVSASVLLEPRANSAAALAESPASYLGEIKSGQRVTIRLSQHELRLPLDQLSASNATTEPFSTNP
ncbi:MAG: hypothetical protein WBW04_08850 [Nitrolancea sp.]